MADALPPVDGAVLDEQLAYYRARAPEYDDWFERVGRYDRGEAATAAWRAERDVVRAWLRALPLSGCDTLELAPGTGLWTAELLAAGATVTAVDAAPEMLDALRRRAGGARLTTIEADLFAWRPPRRFAAVVVCFFVSHVPDERLGAFLSLVADALVAGGSVFVLDSLREPTSTASDHALPSEGSQTMRRRLDDGREFEIVKRFRSDETLATACAAAGLSVVVRRTPTYFQVASGRRDGAARGD